MELKNVKQDDHQKSRPSPPFIQWLLPWLPLFLFWLWIWQGFLGPGNVASMAYSDFKKHLAKNEVIEIALTESEITVDKVVQGFCSEKLANIVQVRIQRN